MILLALSAWQDLLMMLRDLHEFKKFSLWKYLHSYGKRKLLTKAKIFTLNYLIGNTVLLLLGLL